MCRPNPHNSIATNSARTTQTQHEHHATHVRRRTRRAVLITVPSGPAPPAKAKRTSTHAQRLPERTSADSTKLTMSRMNLPNRDPRKRANHTQSPTLAAPRSPSSRSRSGVAPLHSQTRCVREKSSPQSGQGAHSNGSQGTPKAPKWQCDVRKRAAKVTSSRPPRSASTGLHVSPTVGSASRREEPTSTVLHRDCHSRRSALSMAPLMMCLPARGPWTERVRPTTERRNHVRPSSRADT